MVRSILAARELVQGRFLLAMGTRIFDPDLIHAPRDGHAHLRVFFTLYIVI